MLKDNIIRLVVSIMFLWCLLSCSVGPDFEKPTLYSDKEIEKALDLKPSGNGIEKSYLMFNDIVLNKLLGMAIENSPSVRVAIQRLKQARLSVKVEQSKELPVFDAMGQYQYVKESRNIGYVFNQDIYQIGLDASWEIDIFGGVRRRTEEAVANVYATISNLENTYVSLMSEVALAYIKLRQGQSTYFLLTDQLKIQEALLLCVQSLYQSGLVSQDEVNQSKISVQNIQSEMASVQMQLEQAKTQLALLTGRLPTELDDLLKRQKENLVDRDFPFDVNQFFQVSGDVLSLRPDVKASLYQLMAQNAKVGQATADLYPKISLSAMLGFQSLHSDNLFNHKSYAYSLTPGFSIPLFYFGQLKNQLKIQEEKYKELFIQYENTFLTAAEEIKNAMISIQTAQKQYDLIRKNLSETQNIYSLAEKRQKAGLINQIELYQSQLQLLSAHQKWVEANAELYMSVVRFLKSIGSLS